MNATADAVQDWMVDYLSKLLQIPRESVTVDVPFDSFGLDSATLVGMTGDLSTHLGIDVDPTLAYDHPSIEKFARAIAAQASPTVASDAAVA
jgi:acyl carrier protein